MRFYPFGSGSKIQYVVSSSKAEYSNTAEHALLAASASWAISASKGDTGDAGTPSTYHGPYDKYPITC